MPLRAPALLLLACLAGAGCAAPQSLDASAQPEPAPRPAEFEWSTRTSEGSFTGWAAPPVASGAYPSSPPHRAGVEPGTRTLRLTLDATPRDRAEFYVAPPSCDRANVADCRSDENYVDQDHLVYEVSAPEPGIWRFQVVGSGAGVAQVDYKVYVEVEAPAAPG